MRRLLWIIGAASILVVLAWITCGMRYRMPQARAVVVDAVTEAPIAGAVVSARWYAADPVCMHGPCLVGEAAIAEGVTDGAGRATLEAPPTRRRGWTIIDRDSPEISVARAGYVPLQSPPSMKQGTKHFLIAVAVSADGAERYARDLERVRAGAPAFADLPLSPMPLHQREILKTYQLLPAGLRHRVDAELALIARPQRAIRPPD